MGLFIISDLHLSSDNKKSMEVFGPKWHNYMNNIRINWENSITKEDTIIIPGDVSWATYLDDAVDDFNYLDALPGNKIIIKGNHDYWWTTLNKLNSFLKLHSFKSITFLHNNSIIYNDILICGSRGWICPGQEGFTQDDLKIFNREINRLEASVLSGIKNDHKKIIVAMHYPPFDKDNKLNPQVEQLFTKYKVNMCLYGHLHGISQKEAFEGRINQVEYRMVSADYLDFIPLKLTS